MVISRHGVGNVLVVVQEVFLSYGTLSLLSPPVFHELAEHLSLRHAMVEQLGVLGRVVESGNVAQRYLASTQGLNVGIDSLGQGQSSRGQGGDDDVFELSVGSDALGLEGGYDVTQGVLLDRDLVASQETLEMSHLDVSHQSVHTKVQFTVGQETLAVAQTVSQHSQHALCSHRSLHHSLTDILVNNSPTILRALATQVLIDGETALFLLEQVLSLG